MGLVKCYRKNETGQMAVIFAFVLGLIFMAVGAAVDMGAMSSAKSKASDLADGMALAGAIAAREGNSSYSRKKLGENAADAIFEDNTLNKNLATSKPTIVIDDINKEVRVTIDMTVSHSLMGMFGKKSSNVTSAAIVATMLITSRRFQWPLPLTPLVLWGGLLMVIPAKTKMEILQESDRAFV